jgi:chemotaxis protein CheC
VTKPILTPRDLDTLREVGGVGGRRATVALSQLIGREVSLEVSDVAMVSCHDIPGMLHGGEEVVAGLRFRFFGGARGMILLVFPEASARGLVARLTPVQSEGPVAERDDSILKEIGNILASAYLSAMGDRCGIVLIPSVPALVFDLSDAVTDHLAGDLCREVDEALLVTTRFTDPLGEATGRLFLVPDEPSLGLILEAIRRGRDEAR